MDLAKANGTTLVHHSVDTANKCVALAKRHMSEVTFSPDDERTNEMWKQLYIACCYLVGCYHDVGKGTTLFQSYIQSVRSGGKHNPKIEHMVCHNEVGAFFLMAQSKDVVNKLSTLANPSLKIDKNLWGIIWYHVVCHTIYYHHGISKTYNPATKQTGPMDAMELAKAEFSISGSKEMHKVLDIKKLESTFNDISSAAFTGSNLVADTDPSAFDYSGKKSRPPFLVYRKDGKDDERIAILQAMVSSILLAVDQNHIDASTLRCSGTDVLPSMPYGYDSERWEIQDSVIREMIANTKSKQFFVAPAGAGKSSTAVRFLYTQPCTVTKLWIVPRNIIVENTFISLQKEIARLGLELTIEYMYCGCRYSDVGVEMPDDAPISDIVITNVDAFIGSCTNSKYYYLQYAMLHDPVVFDEYHEFISNSPMYAMETIMLNARKVIGVKSVMISATPECEYDIKQDNIIPGPYKHLPAQHQKEYSFSWSEKIPTELGPGEILVAGKIDDCQSVKADIYLHSNFTADDRKVAEAAMMSEFGKDNKGIDHKISLSCAQMLKASLDISCRKIYIVLISFETFIQTLGRCCRWGEYDNPEVVIIPANFESNNLGAITTKHLHQEFLSVMKTMIAGQRLTLDRIYEIYNSFCKQHRDEIRTLHENFRFDGAAQANEADLYPVRYATMNTPTTRIISKPNWRSTEQNCFVTAPDENGNWNGDVLVVDNSVVYGYGPEEYTLVPGKSGLREDDKDNILKCLKHLTKLFTGWADRLNNKKPKPCFREIQRLSHRSDYPFPLLKAVYSSRKGLIYRP